MIAQIAQIEQLTLFNYDDLDMETRVIVQQKATEIKSLSRQTAQIIWDIGEKLTLVKQRLPHGQFGAWLESEFEWTERTARRFMSVFENIKTDNLSDLKITNSVLYEVASPSYPESARQDLLEAAQSVKVTSEMAREMKAKVQELATALKSLKVGDWVKVVNDDIGKVHQLTGKTALVEFGANIPNDKPYYIAYQLKPDYFQAIATIDHDSNWATIDDPMGNYIEEFNQVGIYLITVEDTGLILGVQVRYPDGELSYCMDGEWGLDLGEFSESIAGDRNWWIMKAKEFISLNPLLEEVEEDDSEHKDDDSEHKDDDSKRKERPEDWKDYAEEGNRAGHLKATPKKKKVPNHADFDKWGEGDPVRIISTDQLGNIDAKFPDYVRVKLISDEMSNVGYDDISKPFQPEPKPMLEADLEEILPYVHYLFNERTLTIGKTEEFWTNHSFWNNQVLMIPPENAIAEWLSDTCRHLELGKFSEAIALVPNITDTAWFYGLDGVTACFIWDSDFIAIYYGENHQEFVKTFKKIGSVWKSL